MKAEVITVKANRGVKCRTCEDEKIIKKGERALKVSVRSAGSRWADAHSYFCIPHARSIVRMFAKLDI